MIVVSYVKVLPIPLGFFLLYQNAENTKLIGNDGCCVIYEGQDPPACESVYLTPKTPKLIPCSKRWELHLVTFPFGIFFLFFFCIRMPRTQH